MRVQREDGVALTADDHHEERGRQSDEDEDGRDDDNSRQRLSPVPRTNHVDKTIERI